jgi:hypothetical protein
MLSIFAYALAIPIASLAPWFSLGVYVVVTAIWLVPDRRIERVMGPVVAPERTI